MIRILITEDSLVVAMLLKAIFEQQPDMQVVGHANNGREAVQMAHTLKPDLITMDIRMPHMDGFEATRQIMSNDPTPIVVISSHVDDEEMRITFRAIEEGALAVLEKPPGIGHPNFDSSNRELVDTVRAMAELKVIRRRTLRPAPPPVIIESPTASFNHRYELVAIGCSTGGPQVLQRIFSSLPATFPVPILVTQHISKGFTGGLVAWLNDNAQITVKEVEHGESLQAGIVYFAPDEWHVLVRRSSQGLIAHLSDSPLVNGFRPSATPMFQSIAETCRSGAIGGLLTGMGVDGAEGLLAMKKAGGHTFVQDQESAVVYGMPGAAIELDATNQIVQLDRIAAHLCDLVTL